MIHQRTDRALVVATYGGFVGGLLSGADPVGLLGGLAVATGAGLAALWYVPHAETIVEAWEEFQAERSEGGEQA